MEVIRKSNNQFILQFYHNYKLVKTILDIKSVLEIEMVAQRTGFSEPYSSTIIEGSNVDGTKVIISMLARGGEIRYHYVNIVDENIIISIQDVCNLELPSLILSIQACFEPQ